MPCAFEILSGGSIVVERWSGKVSFAELKSQKEGLINSGSVKPGASVLSDARRATFEVSDAGVEELAAMETAPDIHSPIKRMALLVNDETYEQAKKYMDRVSEAGKRVIIFNSLDVACTWLGLDPHETSERLAKLGQT